MSWGITLDNILDVNRAEKGIFEKIIYTNV
ncbi:hypothetical protein SPPR111872_04660 [Sphingobacterium prati]